MAVDGGNPVLTVRDAVENDLSETRVDNTQKTNWGKLWTLWGENGGFHNQPVLAALSGHSEPFFSNNRF